MAYRLLIRSLFKTIAILAVVLLPILMQIFDSFFMNVKFVIDFDREFQTVSLVLLAASMSHYYTSNIRRISLLNIIFDLYPFFLLMIILALKKSILLPAEQTTVNIDVVHKLSVFLLIGSLLYYLCINIIIESNQTYSNSIETKIIKFEIKLPDAFKLYFDTKGPIFKVFIFTAIRLLSYMVVAVSITQIFKWLYPYQQNTPNDLTVFAAIWGVITFTFETFFSNLKKK